MTSSAINGLRWQEVTCEGLWLFIAEDLVFGNVGIVLAVLPVLNLPHWQKFFVSTSGQGKPLHVACGTL